MSKELGTLVVVVLKARNLPDDHFFKQDVYTKVTLQGVTKKTGVDVKGGQHPQWDEEIRLNVNELSSTTAKMLEIACWSKEPRQDAMIGKGELDISDTLRTGEFDDWVPLKTDKGQRGEIYLEMTWFAAGPPPPLSRRPSKLKPSERLSRPSHTLQPTLAPIPSSPPTTTSRLTSPETSRSGRNSPLPPLPEDSHIPPPEALPSILRPGAGRPKPTQTSPQARPSGVQGSAQHHQRTSSAHDQLGSSFPELLRAGPPNGRTQSQAVDADVPSLSTASLGHSSPPRNLSPPGSFYPQPTLNGHIAPTQQSGYQPIASQQPSYSSHTSPAQRPTSYIAPAPQQPFNHHASPPLQPTYGNQQTSAPQPPSHGPQQTHQPPINPHHDSQPAMYPSQTPAPNPIPGFVIPLWGNQQPQPPPPTGNNAAPSYPGFGYPSPPLHAQARPQSYFAPPPASRPYPYNYTPQRDENLDGPVDPAKAARYRKPLPLPDDGIHPAPAPAPARSSHPPARKQTDDHDVALRLQREEEERQRKQEELDAELARKLDMELNLVSEDSNGGHPNPPAESTINGTQVQRKSSDSMPGAWYRHRAQP